MFKKIQDIIAKSTREEIGQIHLEKLRTFKNINRSIDIPEIKQSKKTIYKWEKRWFQFNRAVDDPRGLRGSRGNSNKFIVPVLSWEDYAIINPIDVPYRDYFYIYDADYNGSNLQLTSDKFDGEETGSFYDFDLLDNLNASYETGILGNGKESQLNISIGSEGVSCSVWVIKYSLDNNNSIFSETTLEYSSNKDSINGFVDISIPVGTLSSYIFVLVYNHDSEDAISRNKNFFTIQTDFRNIRAVGSPFQAPTNDPIILDVVSSADPVTNNISNTININKPAFTDWKSINIYRRKTNNNNTIKYLDDRDFYSLVLLDTSNIDLFNAGSKTNIDNSDYHIRGSLFSDSNKILNGDFSSYTGSNIDNWLQVTDTINATSFPYPGDYISNGNSIRFEKDVTIGAQDYYIENNKYIPVDTSDVLSFKYRAISSTNDSIVKMFFYSSNDGTLSSELSSSTHDLNSGREDRNNKQKDFWFDYRTKMNALSSAESSIFIPSDSKYSRFRFYSSYKATSSSIVLLDNIHIGKRNSRFFYSTSSSDLTAVIISDYFERPRNHLTFFNSYFIDSSQGYISTDIYSSNSGIVKYIDSAWGIQAKFENAFISMDTARNHIGNGAFESGTRLWATSGGFEYSNIIEGSLYHDSYARFNGLGSTQSTISQTVTNSDLFGATAKSLSLWAKSTMNDLNIRIVLEDSIGNVHSSNVVLSSAFEKYTISSSLGASNSITTRMFVDSGTVWSFDVDGIQLEAKGINKNYNIGFSHTDTAAGSLQAQDGLTYSSSDSIDASYGAVRMWWSPLFEYDTSLSSSPDYSGLFFWGTPTGYKSIFYDASLGEFNFRQVFGATINESTVKASRFREGSLFHIVASWDTSNSFLWVNSEKGNTAQSITNTSSSDWSVGINAPSLDTVHAANGIISNFRIDNCTWNESDVSLDFSSKKKLILDNSTVKSFEDQFVGKKEISGNEFSIKFIDDVNLEADSSYSYVIRATNGNDNLSALSASFSVKTVRQPYEKLNLNLWPNSSYEVIDENDTSVPSRFYSRNAGVVGSNDTSYGVTTSKSFKGIRSFRNAVWDEWNGPWIKAKPSTTYNLSYYVLDSAGPLNHVSQTFYYDSAFNKISPGVNVLETINEAIGEFTTSSGHIGTDGNSWLRLSSTFVSSSKPEIAYMHWTIGADGSGDITHWIDAISLTENSKIQKYEETPFIEGGHISPEAINGSHIQFESLAGKHFKTQQITVSSSDGELARIIIGTEDSSSSFSELSANSFRWHAPDIPLAAGWNYTKHIESGVANFGETITFSQRYFDWGGLATVSPLLSITPRDIATFVASSNATFFKDFSFSSNGLDSSECYALGGFVNNIGTDDFVSSVNFGSSNASYGAYFYVVPTSGTIINQLTVFGTKIEDNGTRTTGTSEVMILAAGSDGDYYQTNNKWIGTISIKRTSGFINVPYNYGFVNWWNNDNQDFVLRGLDANWVSGSSDAFSDIILYQNNSTASSWTSSVTGIATPPVTVARLQTDYNTEFETKAGEYGSWKRNNLVSTVDASFNEFGIIAKIISKKTDTFRSGNIQLTIEEI